MTIANSCDSGWIRDLPDHRDYSAQHKKVLRKLRQLPNSADTVTLPDAVDWRSFCSPIVNQSNSASSSAHACVAMVQYFEMRSSGKLLLPSRLFVHQNAMRLASSSENCRVSLRTSLKAMIRFGLPPERYWPYQADQKKQIPDGFVYGYHRALQGCHYVRLDDDEGTGEQALTNIRSFLAAGFSCVIGFPLLTSLTNLPDIHFPINRDDCNQGHAVLVVGYDDLRRIRSDKGALLIRNSWGDSWGEDGYGWLPYTYVTKRLAVDAWTLVKRRWLRSEEFTRPVSIPD